MVAPFIRWLVDRGMVNFGLVADDTNVGFDARFRIQKYVFLAQRLGLDTKYGHSRYRYGPYSPKLAEDTTDWQKIRTRTGPNPKAAYRVGSDRTISSIP